MYLWDCHIHITVPPDFFQNSGSQHYPLVTMEHTDKNLAKLFSPSCNPSDTVFKCTSCYEMIEQAEAMYRNLCEHRSNCHAEGRISQAESMEIIGRQQFSSLTWLMKTTKICGIFCHNETLASFNF